MSGKLRLLCLHGYRQDVTKFRTQTGALRKALKNLVEFEFASAPFYLQTEGVTSRSWWFTQEDSYSSRDNPEECIGLKEAVNHIEMMWTAFGPFDGILGFSQGACFVGLIAAMVQSGKININPKFVVIIAGFKSLTKSHSVFYNEKINIPSLHIFGETDEVIPWEWGNELSQVFENAVVLKHSGGHYVPGTSAYKKTYTDFFEGQKRNLVNGECN